MEGKIADFQEVFDKKISWLKYQTKHLHEPSNKRKFVTFGLIWDTIPLLEHSHEYFV